jgi:hypothetical protein
MKLLYTVLLVVLSSVVFAQSNYHQGYVLKNNGDTLKGFINYREWDQCPRSIDFKINKDDKKAIPFNPATIRKFVINGLEAYYSYTGMISMNRTELAKLPFGLDTSKKRDTVFLKQLITGDHLTLFYHTDGLKIRYFIAEAGTTAVELKYYEYLNDDNQIITVTPYKKQLILYILKFNLGNVKLIDKVGMSRFNQADLESLVDEINGKSDGDSYHNGSVVKNNGDTLKGYIDYREWAQCPKSIDFKINIEDSKPMQFNPETIRKFVINGLEAYYSYTGMISMNRTELSNIPFGLDAIKKRDTIFLKQLIAGDHLTLFYHTDDLKIRYFVAESKTTPVELEYYAYLNNDNQIITTTPYKKQLILYILKFNPGNVKLINKVGESRFNQANLESLVNEINGKSDSDLNNGKNAIRRKSQFRLFAGIGINSTKTELHDGSTPSPNTFSTTLLPQISVGVDMFANPNVQQIIFRVELSFSETSPQFNSSSQNRAYSFSQQTIAMTPQIVVNIYNKENFKFYLDCGMKFNFSSYDNLQPTSLASPWANFPLQAGFVLNKKIEIAFTYIGYAGFTRYSSDFSLSNRTTGFGIKYLFGSK